MRFVNLAATATVSITVFSLLAACQTTPDPISTQEQAKNVPPAPPVVVITPTEYHTLEKCEKPLGSLRVNELGVSPVSSKPGQRASEASAANAAWLNTLTTEHNLPVPRALVQWLALQSNCFKVLELDASLADAPLKPVTKKVVRKPVAVPADYTVSAKVDFNTTTQEQFQGVVGTFSPAVGAVQSPIKTMDASTQLVLNARRSNAELGVAVGKAANKDFSFNQLMGNSIKVEPPVSLLVYESKPEGRLLAGAFVHSFNQMVKTAQEYQLKTAKSASTRRTARPAVKPVPVVPKVSSGLAPTNSAPPPAYVPIYKRPSM